MSRRRSRSPSPGRYSRSCSSNDPRDLERRIFVGNLPTSNMEKKDLEELFSPYGKVGGVSMFRGFGFVQFERVEDAEAAKVAQKGRLYKGYKIDVNMATERRHAKPQSQQSPPRRSDYGSYGDSREARPRSRSPYVRESREPREPRESRDSRDGRDVGREPRTGSHPRDQESRYRGSGSREKDARSDTRDPAFREDLDRYYRSGSGADDFYRRKEEQYRETYRDPWNGRREAEATEDRARPEERRRNELYRQYYEELQRRYDTERPVDCSVIVVNKAQKEYAETVGRKVRDLGMVVDLIFLNTEVSLTQALEDVGRARTPFAIIITQQHQVHRSCTVNILFGTPQEHRNMPMQDAMMLVAHNYDTYKVEHREKEREEIARKAAKMADDVLLREPDSENHPVSVLTAITLLSENRFVTPEELDGLVAYLKDKRARLVRSSAEPLATASARAAAPAAAHHEAAPAAAPLAPPPHSTALHSTALHSTGLHSTGLHSTGLHSTGLHSTGLHSTGLHSTALHSTALHSTALHSTGLHSSSLHSTVLHSTVAQPGLHSLPPVSSAPATPSHQQELQAKILSLFNSGTGSSALGPPASSSMPPQSYGSMVVQQQHPRSALPTPSLNPPRQSVPSGPPPPAAHGYGGPPSRMPVTPGGQRPPATTAGINFEDPSVQKALDTLIQSGPALNHLVTSQQPPPRPNMGQAPPMSMYPRHY
ncbi:nuclear receptor coactivator 5 isoform X2 [Genypterus blacodes]|uniref:nuclear receptor coactivator 5 isoform X2 n=1 Tax=Genypterus blacodes TaxID=154954 RepID=UPI003F77125D